MKRRFLVISLLLFFCLGAQAQTIEITKMEIKSKKIYISYNIEDDNPNNEYLVTVYSSADNFSAPLTKLEGDVGQEVKPGLNTAVWDIFEEFGQYQGSLSLEVRASVFVPFVRLRNFNDGGKYKRGKSYDLEWRPGNTNPVHIELYKEGTRLQGELNHPNNGEYTMTFNSDLKAGSDYRIKITDSRQPDDFVFTNEFKVTKFPIWPIIIPVAAGVGYLVYSLVSGGTDGAGQNDLPEFPAVPENN